MSTGFDFRTLLVGASYLIAATLFLLGLQRMASPATARSGIQWAGWGMLIATAATFLLPGLHNMPLIVTALVVGTVAAWISGKKVAITDMPQMVALYNGMGGGSAAAIGAVELLRFASLAHGSLGPDGTPPQPNAVVLTLAVLGSAIGAVSLSGSVIAWAKLDGRLDRRVVFPGQQAFNLLVAVAMVVLGVMAAVTLQPWAIVAFFVVALALGVLTTLPIGGADMPVVISLYNAFTGLAVAFEGYVLGNEALIIAGMMVGAAGILLTRLMAKAMNRPITGVLFGSFGGGGQQQEITGAQKPIEAGDVAAMMAYAERVVIVPGYGLPWPSPAQDLGTGAAADRARGEGQVRDPPGRRAHARAHERAAGRGRRPVRPDRRHGRHQPGVPEHRRVAGDRRQRRGQPGGQDRPGQPDLWHADPGRGRVEEHHCHQARQGHRFRRHRERAVLRRQHPHALRRRR